MWKVLMNNPKTKLNAEQLAAVAHSYFAAADARDLDAVFTHFDPNIVHRTLGQPGELYHKISRGIEELRPAWEDYFARGVETHEITNLVVDEGSSKVSTEQVIWDVRDDESVPVQYNCNFFDIGPNGKITRMVVWMSRHESQK